MKNEKEERKPYVAIIRRKDSEYTIFANKVEGDHKVDKFVTIYTTTKDGKERKIDLASELIAEYEYSLPPLL